MMNASNMMLAQRDDEDKENRFDPLGDANKPVDKKKQKVRKLVWSFQYQHLDKKKNKAG